MSSCRFACWEQYSDAVWHPPLLGVARASVSTARTRSEAEVPFCVLATARHATARAGAEVCGLESSTSSRRREEQRTSRYEYYE